MSMKTKIERLKEVIKGEIKRIENPSLKLSKRIVVNELTFIEARHMEDYFLVAHQLMTGLKMWKSFFIQWSLMKNQMFALVRVEQVPFQMES